MSPEQPADAADHLLGRALMAEQEADVAWGRVRKLRAEVERLRAALHMIATGRDEQGLKVDCYQAIAREALGDE